MIWGFKLVGVDLHTCGTGRPLPGTQLGAWNEADGPIIDANTNGCLEHRATAVRRSTQAPSPRARPRPLAMR